MRQVLVDAVDQFPKHPLTLWLLEPLIGFERVKLMLKDFIGYKLTIGRSLIHEGNLHYEVIAQ